MGEPTALEHVFLRQDGHPDDPVIGRQKATAPLRLRASRQR
jgi:hypothetical protein